MLDKISNGGTNFSVLEYQTSDDKPLLSKFNKVKLKIEITTKKRNINREKFENFFYDNVDQAEQLLRNMKPDKFNSDSFNNCDQNNNQKRNNISVQLSIINLTEFGDLYIG